MLARGIVYQKVLWRYGPRGNKVVSLNGSVDLP